MAKFWKKKQFWGTLVGLALLIYCVKDIRPSEIQSLLERVDPIWLIPTILTGFFFISLKGMRWRLMVTTQKRIPFMRAIPLYATGQFLGIVMPALTGQVGRLILFARKEQLRKTFVFSTIVLEILFDAISLIVFMLFTSLAFVFPANYRYMSFVVAGVTAVAVILLYMFTHYRTRLERINRKLLRERRPGVYITITKFIRSFGKGVELLRSSQHVFGSLAYSLALWMVHVFVVWFLMLAFGLDLPLAAAAVVMIINTVVLMVPITPGNAGTFEFAVSTSLAAFSVGRSDAVLFALALHLIDLLPTFVFGFLFLHQDKTSIREIRTKHGDEVILDKVNEEGTFIEEEKV